MNVKNLAMMLLAAGTLAYGQYRLPSMSSVKDKLAGKTNTAKPAAEAPAPATSTEAASTAPTTASTAPTSAAPEASSANLPAAGPVKGELRGQGVELTLCEKPAREGQWDVKCEKPTVTFEYKGSVTNVAGTLRFNPPLTSRGVGFRIQVFKKGTLDGYRDITFRTGGRTAIFTMTMTPGLYTVKVVDTFDTDQIALTENFMVNKDTVGDRAVDNIKSGIGKLMVCSEIDDNWKCVNESTTWAANKPFNLYVRLPQAISGQVAGWSIFKQLPDGTDGQFVEDLLQGTNGRAAYWATTDGHKLPAGTYTIYSINWANRATIGNLKSYFAKTTLVVK